MQIVLVTAAALFYFAVRGLTEGDVDAAVENGQSLLDLEARFGLAMERSAQEWLIERRSLVTVANWVYIWGHWPVIIASLVWLARRRHDDFVLLRNALFASGAIGLVLFAVYPVAPPRLLPDAYVDTVTLYSESYRVLQPPALVNKYAAMPSLHFGWNLLVGIFLVRTATRSGLRMFGLIGPMLMAAAVVLTGNHYVVDVLVGGSVALLGLAIATGVSRPTSY